MKKMLFVGIDISADELVVAVERDGEALPVTSFAAGRDPAATGHFERKNQLPSSLRASRASSRTRWSRSVSSAARSADSIRTASRWRFGLQAPQLSA
jgi:Flp pilus assembly secretin CpaC